MFRIERGPGGGGAFYGMLKKLVAFLEFRISKAFCRVKILQSLLMPLLSQKVRSLVFLYYLGIPQILLSFLTLKDSRAVQDTMVERLSVTKSEVTLNILDLKKTILVSDLFQGQ